MTMRDFSGGALPYSAYNWNKGPDPLLFAHDVICLPLDGDTAANVYGFMTLYLNRTL